MCSLNFFIVSSSFFSSQYSLFLSFFLNFSKKFFHTLIEALSLSKIGPLFVSL